MFPRGSIFRLSKDGAAYSKQFKSRVTKLSLLLLLIIEVSSRSSAYLSEFRRSRHSEVGCHDRRRNRPGEPTKDRRTHNALARSSNRFAYRYSSKTPSNVQVYIVGVPSITVTDPQRSVHCTHGGFIVLVYSSGDDIGCRIEKQDARTTY